MVIGEAILNRAEGSLGESLPRIGGAIALLVVGLLLAWLLGRLVYRALRALDADAFGERFGIHDAIARFGFDRSLSRLLGRAVRIALSIVVVVAAVSLLGLGALGSSLNAAVLFVPKLFVALVLVVLGLVIGEFVRDRVDRLADQMALGLPLGRLAQIVVIALFLLTALAQLEISTAILTAMIGVLVLAAALTTALAFGLGSREVAREISAGRYVGTSFEIGQDISVDGLRGEIVRLDPAATLLRTAAGETVRVPNHLLLESIVTLHEAQGEAP
jgi:small-conductance mechanosensitive channel